MAGDWLKVEKSTPEKPEVLAMAAVLNLDPDIVFSRLFKMWCWFDANTTDGNARGVTFALLDRHIGVTGFCDAALHVGWLSVTATGLQLPNFDYHNGQSAKDRANTAKRVAKHRKSNGESNGENVTSPLAREEKRREEKNKDKKPLSSGDDEGQSRIAYDEIFDVYEEVLCKPPLGRPSVKLRDDKRKAAIKKIIKARPNAKDPEWWRRYFGAAATNDHWMQGDKHKGGTWDGANFDFLLRDDIFKKILEGNV